MADIRTYLIVEYRAADGEYHLNETHAFGTMAELVSEAPSFNWDIASVTRLTISHDGVTSEDASEEAAKLVMQRYDDDEDGIPEDWDVLFHRAGYSLDAVNAETRSERYDPRQHSTLSHAMQGTGWAR